VAIGYADPCVLLIAVEKHTRPALRSVFFRSMSLHIRRALSLLSYVTMCYVGVFLQGVVLPMTVAGAGEEGWGWRDGSRDPLEPPRSRGSLGRGNGAAGAMTRGAGAGTQRSRTAAEEGATSLRYAENRLPVRKGVAPEMRTISIPAMVKRIQCRAYITPAIEFRIVTTRSPSGSTISAISW